MLTVARELDRCSGLLAIKYSAQEPDRSSARSISGKDFGCFRPGCFRPGCFLFSTLRSNEVVI